ncbi:MAG TPA: YdeI/OmpD-associated family protein [Gemmatimonas sp.]|uniref:YdeI/OmpD-associated family protein n=1 Tax=Gemmatimonas sp. TaxID=1962908 RepID=UPI002EDA88BD
MDGYVREEREAGIVDRSLIPTVPAKKTTSTSPAAEARYFASAAAFRTWLDKHHGSKSELLVGFHKIDSGHPSMTWTESVREALCFGWIDGVRRRVDDERYTIRFTPRRAGSIWSAVNVKHVEELEAAGLMAEAGRRAFEARKENKVGIYAFEQVTVDLPEPFASRFRKKKKAFAFFESQAPSYRKVAVWWVVSAKREDTREARFTKLLDCSARGERLP